MTRTPEESFDGLILEADWADMHGGGHHDDNCEVCRDIANVRTALETAAVSQPAVQSEDTIPLADHDEIGRRVIGQPWAIQAAIVTICAHCTVLVDKHPTGDVADLAGCISDQCRELANALSSGVAQAVQVPSAVERFQKRIVEMMQAGCTGFHFTSGSKWHSLTIEEKCAAMLEVWDAKQSHLDFKDSYAVSSADRGTQA